MIDAAAAMRYNAHGCFNIYFSGVHMNFPGKFFLRLKSRLPAIKKVPAYFMLYALAISLLPSCGSKTNSMIIVAGSTSVQPYAEILAEDYAHLHPDQVVDVQGGGSSAGITAAESGTAEIGMSSRNLKNEEQSLWSVEIAKDGLAIIVNPGNPIDDLTIEQIQQIYSADIPGWGALGGRDTKIHIITREEGSGTRSAFEELVMGTTALITPRAIVQDSNGAVKQLVADDVDAIGFISMGLVDNTVKALRLGGVTASVDNVINGSYSLSRPFLFVANGPPEGLSKQFIDFTLSDEGQQTLIKEGLIPADKSDGGING